MKFFYSGGKTTVFFLLGKRCQYEMVKTCFELHIQLVHIFSCDMCKDFLLFCVFRVDSEGRPAVVVPEKNCTI